MAKPALDVALVTADAQPLIDFHEGVVRLKILAPLELPAIGTSHKVACCESLLRVMVPSEAPAKDAFTSFSAISGIRYLTLEVDDIDAAAATVERLSGTGVLAPLELYPGRRVAQVADLEGNMIELGQDLV